MAILRRHGAYDMSNREAPAAAAQPRPPRPGPRRRTTARATTGREGDTIEVKEERLHAEKRPVETGEVTVRKEVHTETKTLGGPGRARGGRHRADPRARRAATEGIASATSARAKRSASRSARSRSTSPRRPW